MSNYVPGDGVRDVYVKDSGNNDNTGANILFAVKTLDRAASIAGALAPPPSITAPASIVDSGASLYFGPFQQPDSVQIAMDFSAISLPSGGGSATAISAGAASQMTWLTVSTSSTAGDVAYSTNGKSRVSLDSRALICNGPGQIGYSADGVSTDYFCQVGQVLARFDDATCVSVTATGNEPRALNFNELNMEGINSVGILYASTATSPASINASAVTDTGGAGNVGIHVVSGHVSCFVNELRSETAILVKSGAILDLFDAHINGDITVESGGVLNISALEFSGVITNNGIINGVINGTRYGNSALIPLSTTRYVDAGASSLNRDGSIENPYNSTAEATASITDASTSNRYTLKISKDDGFSFIPKPWISYVGDSRESVITGTIDIRDTGGIYFFENLIASSVTGTTLNNQMFVHFKYCVIQGSSNIFSLIDGSLASVLFEDTTILNDLDVRQIPVEFRGGQVEDFVFKDFTLSDHQITFNGVTITGAITGEGSTADNPATFVNCLWGASSSFSSPWNWNITTDSSSFPFESSAQANIVDRISKAKIIEYDNSSSGLPDTNVQGALDSLAMPGGGAYAMSGVAVTTPISAASTPAKIVTGGADTGYQLEGFTHSDNRLTRDGPTRRYLIIVAVSGNNASAGTNNGRIHLYKNGVALPEEISMDSGYNANDNHGVTAAGIVPLSDTEFIEVFIENIDNAEDFETVDLNVTLIEWRV